MNLNLTTKCNNHCPYCFQEGRTKLEHEMSIENCIKIINFWEDSLKAGEKIAILGGEPTLYSNFIPVTKYVMHKYPKNNIVIITNLLGDNTNIEFISKQKKLYLLINTTYDFNKEELFLKNLSRLKYLKRVSLSVTLLDNPKINKAYIDRLYKIVSTNKNFDFIRLGLMTPKPSDSLKNIYNYDMDLDYLLEKLETTNIKTILFDCPINFCQISQKMYKKILLQNRYIVLKLRSDICSPVIDINPDNSSTYCSSFTKDEFKIDDIFKYSNCKEIIGKYNKARDNYKVKNSRCNKCVLFKNVCFPCHSFDQALLRGEESEKNI